MRPGNSSQSNFRHFGSVPAFESLESRRLLSTTVFGDGFYDRLASHQLTQEELTAANLTDVNGTYARSGSWVVQLRDTGATTGLFTDSKPAGPATPIPTELQQAFADLGLGITVERYLGSTRFVLVHAPGSADAEQVREALMGLDIVQSANPDIMVSVGLDPASAPILPQVSVDLDIVPWGPDVTVVSDSPPILSQDASQVVTGVANAANSPFTSTIPLDRHPLGQSFASIWHTAPSIFTLNDSGNYSWGTGSGVFATGDSDIDELASAIS